MTLDEFHRMIGEGVGGVKRFVGRAFRVFDWSVPKRHSAWVNGMKETCRTSERAKVPIESALLGPQTLVVHTQMPLTCHQSHVAVLSKHFGHSDAVVIEESLIVDRRTFVGLFARRERHVSDAHLMWVQSRHQCRSGRAATAAVVELIEANAAMGQSVDIGRVDLASVTTDVRVAHIVHHDQDDVGAISCIARSFARGDGDA